MAIIGCGATGSIQAELLARLGVGFIRVVDKDLVDISNLPRVHLMYNEDAEKALPKAIACAERIKAIDPEIEVEPLVMHVDPSNIFDVVRDVDMIIDGTDNMEVRYVINDAAVKLGKPWIYVGAEMWYGNVLFIKPRLGPRLRCFVPSQAAERQGVCDILGVVNTVVDMAASIASTLALKHLLGLEVDYTHLYVVDAVSLEVTKVRIHRNEKCPACGLGRFEHLEKKVETGATRICGTNAVEILPPSKMELNLLELARKFDASMVSAATKHTIKINISDIVSIVVFRDGRAIVDGLVDEKKAWSIYEEFILSKLRGETC